MASRQYRKAVGRFTTAALNLHDSNMTIKVSLTGTYRCLHWRSHLIVAFGWIIWALAYVLVMKITSNLLQVHSSFTPEWQTVAAWYWRVSLYPSYKILKCDHSNESQQSSTFLLCCYVYIVVHVGSNFESVDKIKGRDCSKAPIELYLPPMLFIVPYKAALSFHSWLKCESNASALCQFIRGCKSIRTDASMSL